jgi:TPR repeat protein
VRPGPVIAIALAAGVVVFAALLAQRPPAPEAPPPAPAAAPAPPPATAGPPTAAREVPASASALAPRVLRAVLHERLHSPALSRERLEALGAGRMPAVAAALREAHEPGAAALLADLAALCESLPAAEDGAAARTALGAASRDASAATALERLSGAVREAAATLGAGCAATSFDATALRAALEASARAGDPHSVERLAFAGRGDAGRLASAALLGMPRAQLRLALDQLPGQPATARSWLEAAAKQDPEAEALLGACLLGGCGAGPDPVAARAVLESAAGRGAPVALGWLAAGAGGEDTSRWSPAGALVAPLPPAQPEALGLTPIERYAWAALAGDLAADGCFGFDLDLAAGAFAARARLERSLSPAEAAEGAAAAAALESRTGATARAARGCR